MEVVDPSMPPMLASRISIEIEIVVTAIIALWIDCFLSGFRLGRTRDSFELVFDHHFVREVAVDGATLHLRLGLISIC